MPYKILIVEDDPFLLNMYVLKLKKSGFDVCAAEDGKAALSKAKSENPNLILLDILIPKLDGFDVLKRLKKDKKFKEIPVILLTNLGQKEDVEKGLELGASDYLIKAHFTPQEVISKIEKLVK